MELYYCKLDSPVGRFLVAGSEKALLYTSFPSGKGQKNVESDWRHDKEPLKYATDQFEAYFSGEDINVDIPHIMQGTEFQQRVWEALKTIGYGKTMSYQDIAERIGNPKACQAVGLANGANKLPILIPCHRVIGANGSMTGFGGGIRAKEILLQLEGIPSGADQLSLFN